MALVPSLLSLLEPRPSGAASQAENDLLGALLGTGQVVGRGSIYLTLVHASCMTLLSHTLPSLPSWGHLALQPSCSVGRAMEDT